MDQVCFHKTGLRVHHHRLMIILPSFRSSGPVSIQLDSNSFQEKGVKRDEQERDERDKKSKKCVCEFEFLGLFSHCYYLSIKKFTCINVKKKLFVTSYHSMITI